MALRSWRLALLCSGFLVVALPHSAQAGKLDDFERATGPDRSRSDDSDSSSRDSDSDSGSGSHSGSRWGSSSGGSTSVDGDGTFARGLAWMFLSPFKIPYAFDDQCRHGFAAYPDRDGFLRNADWDAACARPIAESASARPSEHDVVRRMAGNASIEGAYALGGLWGGGVTGQLLLPHRLDLSTRVGLLADFSERPVDQAVLSNTTLSLRFAQTAVFAARAGLGLRTFFLHERRYGPDFFYALSAYGRHHIRFDGEVHLGALSRAFTSELRATLGVMLGKVELYGGYNFLHARGAAGGATLQGPVLGLRLWL